MMLKSIKFSAMAAFSYSVPKWVHACAFSESEVKSSVLSVTVVPHQGLSQNVRKHIWLPMVYLP